MEDLDENLLERYVFAEDYFLTWKEMHGTVQADDAAERFSKGSEMLNNMAKSNNQFISVFDTRKQKVLFLSNNLNEVLGFNCTLDSYKQKPIVYWLKSVPMAQSWFLMQITLFFKTNVKNLLKTSENPSLSWYFHNMRPQKRSLGILGKVLEIDKKGMMVVMMSIMRDVSQYNKDEGVWWGEVLVNQEKSFVFHEDNKKFIPGKLLSEREHEVLKLIKEGYETKEIADKLFLSTFTVETHRKNMLNKSGAKNTTSLIQMLGFTNMYF